MEPGLIIQAGFFVIQNFGFNSPPAFAETATCPPAKAKRRTGRQACPPLRFGRRARSRFGEGRG